MMTIENKITVNEINGCEVTNTYLTVRNHPIFDDRIIIEFAGNALTVFNRELSKAIDNACNHT